MVDQAVWSTAPICGPALISSPLSPCRSSSLPPPAVPPSATTHRQPCRRPQPLPSAAAARGAASRHHPLFTVSLRSEAVGSAIAAARAVARLHHLRRPNHRNRRCSSSVSASPRSHCSSSSVSSSQAEPCLPPSCRARCHRPPQSVATAAATRGLMPSPPPPCWPNYYHGLLLPRRRPTTAISPSSSPHLPLPITDPPLLAAPKLSKAITHGRRPTFFLLRQAPSPQTATGHPILSLVSLQATQAPRPSSSPPPNHHGRHLSGPSHNPWPPPSSSADHPLLPLIPLLVRAPLCPLSPPSWLSPPSPFLCSMAASTSIFSATRALSLLLPFHRSGIPARCML